MLTTEQQRVKLETLLQRVHKNRPRLGPGPATSAGGGPPPVPEAAAPSALPSAAMERSLSPQEDMTEGLMLESTPSLDLEVSETDSLELDLDSPVEDVDGMEIELSSADDLPEAEAPPAPPSAQADTRLETPSTIAEPSPIKKPPPIPAEESEPAAADDFDDEPEIEVAYGTEEALALQAELGLGDDDDLVDMDTLVTPDDQAAVKDDREMAFDDLPVPAPPEADLDELLEPAEEEISAPPKQQDTSTADRAARNKLRAKTVEDLSAPLIELALNEKIREKATPVSGDDMPTPRPEPAPPRRAEGDTLANALTTAAAEPAAKPAPKPAKRPAARPAVAQAPRASSAQAYSAEKMPADEAQVAEFVGAVPTPRVKSFGDLIAQALSVGRK